MNRGTLLRLLQGAVPGLAVLVLALLAVHLVVLPGYLDWKLLKLLDSEFANSIQLPEGTR